MRTDTLRLGPLVLVFALIGGGGHIGCASADCEGVSCAGPAIEVRRPTSAFPGDARVQLCIDGACETVQTAPAGGMVRVSRPVDRATPPERRFDVALVLTTGAGRVERRGTGRLADGGCCPYLTLTVDGDRLQR
jgi:hypothetical protein